MWGSVLRNILLKAAKKISIVLVIRCNDIYDDVFHDLYCILKGDSSTYWITIQLCRFAKGFEMTQCPQMHVESLMVVK